MKQFLFIMATLLTLAVVPSLAEDYPLNFDKNAVNGKGNYMRYLHTITFAGRVLTVHEPPSADAGDTWPIYYDRTDYVFSAKAGKKYTIKFDYPGGWMHGYAYIDFGRDGQFSYNTDPDTHKPGPGSDMVSYSYVWYPDGATNSDGVSPGTNNTLVMPQFTLPRDMQSGDYHMRFKIDWSSPNPGGSDDIVSNNGAVVDCILRVTNTTGIESINTDPAPEAPTSIYNLQGQRVEPTHPGIYIKNGRKFVKK